MLISRMSGSLLRPGAVRFRRLLSAEGAEGAGSAGGTATAGGGGAAAAAAAAGVTKGPKLPPHNDPAAYEGQGHSAGLAQRWLLISGVATAIVVGGYFRLVEHGTAPDGLPEYTYLKRAARSPRFPWGEKDLIGTPADRGEKH